MKQLVIIGAVVLAVCAAIFFYMTHKNSVPAYQEPKEAPGMALVGMAKDSTDPFDVEITFNDEGFAPTEVTIKKGQRVRFINKSSTAQPWPASGVHPTHTLYPEKEPTDCLGSSFDACRPLKLGEFFDFTFNYAGEWRYHDHTHAYYTGVITVKP